MKKMKKMKRKIQLLRSSAALTLSPQGRKHQDPQATRRTAQERGEAAKHSEALRSKCAKHVTSLRLTSKSFIDVHGTSPSLARWPQAVRPRCGSLEKSNVPWHPGEWPQCCKKSDVNIVSKRSDELVREILCFLS